jgi:hypothetical protein
VGRRVSSRVGSHCGLIPPGVVFAGMQLPRCGRNACSLWVRGTGAGLEASRRASRRRSGSIRARVTSLRLVCFSQPGTPLCLTLRGYLDAALVTTYARVHRAARFLPFARQIEKKHAYSTSAGKHARRSSISRSSHKSGEGGALTAGLEHQWPRYGNTCARTRHD